MTCAGIQVKTEDNKGFELAGVNHLIPWIKINSLFPAGIEPATSPMLRVRDNHYTKETGYDIVRQIAVVVDHIHLRSTVSSIRTKVCR